MAAPFYTSGTPASRSWGLNAWLIPESDFRATGSGPELLLERYTGELLEFSLHITRVNERTSLDLAIWGSCDGQEWGARPLIHFPRKYHCGESKIQWDPADFPFVQRLRAQWQVDRWGPGDGKPLVALALHVREMARNLAKARAAGPR